MKGFDKNDPKPIKGFKGLKLLISDTDEVGKAFIYIMEFLRSPRHINLRKNYKKLCSCLETLSEDLIFSPAELKSFISTCDEATVESDVNEKMFYLLASFALGASVGNNKDEKGA
jgi:hypothetical protein